MKKLLLSLVATMIVTMSFAQSSMLATLSHDGEITTFYGASALAHAHAAAVSGDVITLSSGTFSAINITKGVTIRGAGMAFDPQTQSEPTIITNDFTIEIPTTDTSRLTIEGIYHNASIYYKGTLTGAMFMKSRFKTISYNNSSNDRIVNLTMLHCRVANKMWLSGNSSAACINCVVCYPYSFSDATSNYEFTNCIVIGDGSSPKSSSFKNCYFYNTYSNYLNSSDMAFNCVSDYSYMFTYVPANNNKIASTAAVFKSFNGTYSDQQTFELTDTAKETYKGIDGTEIGIYGGNMPFSAVTTNPQITKCNVAAKSTADGKLSVDIEVNGGE